MTETGPNRGNDEAIEPMPRITIRDVHVMPGTTPRNLLEGMGVDTSGFEMLVGSLDDAYTGEPYQLTEEQTDQLLIIQAEADAEREIK